MLRPKVASAIFLLAGLLRITSLHFSPAITITSLSLHLHDGQLCEERRLPPKETDYKRCRMRPVFDTRVGRNLGRAIPFCARLTLLPMWAAAVLVAREASGEKISLRRMSVSYALVPTVESKRMACASK